MLEKIIAFCFGACLGSFLNVCICRLPKEESAVRPPSACPRCKVPIKWYDNIPLLSYIILKAKCRSCGDKISLRYPLVELISAILVLVLYLKFGLALSLFKFIFLNILL